MLQLPDSEGVEKNKMHSKVTLGNVNYNRISIVRGCWEYLMGDDTTTFDKVGIKYNSSRVVICVNRTLVKRAHDNVTWPMAIL